MGKFASPCSPPSSSSTPPTTQTSPTSTVRTPATTTWAPYVRTSALLCRPAPNRVFVCRPISALSELTCRIPCVLHSIVSLQGLRSIDRVRQHFVRESAVPLAFCWVVARFLSVHACALSTTFLNFLRFALAESSV